MCIRDRSLSSIVSLLLDDIAFDPEKYASISKVIEIDEAFVKEKLFEEGDPLCDQTKLVANA